MFAASKPRSRRSRQRGFTLIELMVVVAIIGILASMAIPSFDMVVRRSKKTEMFMNHRKFIDSMKDYVNEHGRWPQGSVDSSSISTGWNPPLPLSGKKKPWQKNLFPWSAFSFEPEGWLYYHYNLYGQYSKGGEPTMYVYTQGDLDNDGLPQYCATYLQQVRGTWIVVQPYEYDYCWGDDW